MARRGMLLYLNSYVCPEASPVSELLSRVAAKHCKIEIGQRARALIQIWLSNTYVVSLSCSLQDVKIKLAQAYGYCWGVERAVQMAYEARKQYPGASLHVTNEIIHNPAVNQVSCLISHVYRLAGYSNVNASCELCTVPCVDVPQLVISVSCSTMREANLNRPKAGDNVHAEIERDGHQHH